MSGRIVEFRQQRCEVLGVSTDAVDTHQRWLTTPPGQGGLGPIQFPLASDPDGAVCTQYGVYVERQHVALRGLFIIDPNGVLQYQVVHSLSVGRSTDEVLRVLDALQSGGLCPGEREIGQPSIDVLAELGPNRVVGPYEVEAELGSGAFGTVFKARDQLLDRSVALKVLRPNADVPTESLLAEARAAAALNHPGLCTVYAVDTSHGVAMIVMEYVKGQPLSVRLAAGKLVEETAAALGRQIAEAMAVAHDGGVVHGDLKPGNLMITPEGSIKVMDFGLARRVIPPQQQNETIVWTAPSNSGLSGTPGYMAPEQARGEPTSPATDVFALGLIICEMLTGRPAVTGKNLLDTLRQIEQFDASQCTAGLPDPLADILQAALASAPSDRPSMRQLAGQLA